MSSTALQEQPLNVAPQTFAVAKSSLSAERLTDKHKAETLSFLSARPLHTVFLAGFIHDYGLESHMNRGMFYACRNSQGRLEGVAMIGNVILFETESEAALKTFSRVAQDCNFARVILGEQKKGRAVLAALFKGRSVAAPQASPITVRAATAHRSARAC